jgi:hypothetical protein
MKNRGYAHRVSIGWPVALIVWIVGFWSAAGGAAESRYAYTVRDQVFSYTLKSTGENFTFEFEENPGNLNERLGAALHVFQSAYDDGSIQPRHSSFFTKEGAKCFVFDARFHTYTTCFLPNDYSPGKENRFWGYVTQVPNGMWLVTRNLVPALLLLGFFAFLLRRKPQPRRDDTAPIPDSPGSYRPVR